MSISNAAAQRTYQDARDALSSIVASRRSTQTEKNLARRRRDLLDAEFIGQQLDEIEARTAQFEKFVEEMEAVTARLERNSLVSAIRRVREVTENAKELLDD